MDDRGRGEKEQIGWKISAWGSIEGFDWEIGLQPDTSTYNLLSREGFDWVNLILDSDAHLDIRLTIPPKIDTIDTVRRDTLTKIVAASSLPSFSCSSAAW